MSVPMWKGNGNGRGILVVSVGRRINWSLIENG